MKENCCPYFAILVILLIVGTAYQLSGDRETSYENGTMEQFVNYLNRKGIQFTVVPSMPEGSWSDSHVLSRRPDETMESIGRRALSTENSEGWKDIVYVWRIGPQAEASSYLDRWGENGCRLGSFLLFGDAHILGAIQRVFPDTMQ